MYTLSISDQIHYIDVLKSRIYKENQYDLLPVYGTLKFFGILNFGKVYVDNLDPCLVTKIICQCKRVTEDMLNDSVACYNSNIDVLSDYSLVMWADNGITNMTNCFPFVNPDHVVTSYASTPHSCTMFIESFPDTKLARPIGYAFLWTLG